MATIRDVAALAGVSPTTVSYALNRPDRVTDKLRVRVEAAVQALDYRPNGSARALRTGRNHLVSLIVPDVANHFYAGMARGVADALKPRGLHVVVGSTDADASEEMNILKESAMQQAAGVIIVPLQLTPDQIQEAAGPGIPLVLLGPEAGSGKIPCTEFDNLGGAEQAVQYLLEQGRRRIVYVGGLPGASSSVRRHTGYLAAHKRFNVQPDRALHIAGNFQRAGAEQAMRDLLDSGAPFDAVFAANDLMAIGAMRVLRQRGVRIPEDVAVVGFDDIDEAEIVEPALTTVRQPAYEGGRRAASLLLEQIDGHVRTKSCVVIPTTLVRRESA